MERKRTNLKAFLVPFLGVIAYSVVSFAAGTKGGSGTGGGDYILGTKVTPDEAAIELAQIKPYVRAALNELDIDTHAEYDDSAGKRISTPSIVVQARQTLFGGENTVFDLLKVVQVDALQSAPCRDSAGAPKAGSVYDTSPDDICLSVQTASQQLTSDNLFPQLVGIYVHELTHKMGGDEALAQWTQGVVIAGVTATSKQNFENMKRNLRAELKSELQDVAQLTKDIDGSLADTSDDVLDPDINRDLNAMEQDNSIALSFLSEAQDIGLSPLDRVQLMSLTVMVGRTSLASLYTLKSVTVDDGRTFNMNKTKILLANQVFSTDFMYQDDHDQIIQVGYHDKVALKKAIQQIKSETIDLLNALQAE